MSFGSKLAYYYVESEYDQYYRLLLIIMWLENLQPKRIRFGTIGEEGVCVQLVMIKFTITRQKQAAIYTQTESVLSSR